MATQEQYAQWIVANQAKKGTPEFETVAQAYKVARQQSPREAQNFAGDQGAIDAAHAGVVNPAEDMTGGQRFAAGAGAGASRIARGIRQIGAVAGDLAGGINTASGPMQTPRYDAMLAEEMQARELEAPLMNTDAGAAGNIAGTIGAIAPTALIPSAATLPGAAMIGGGVGFVGTPGTSAERMEGAKFGLAGGPAGIAAGRTAALGLRAVGNRAAKAGAENAVRNASAREAIAAGRVLPPSELAQSGPGKFFARTAEAVAGKDAMGQSASVINQRVTNAGIRKDLGIGGKGQISVDDIDAAKRPHIQVYEDAARISPDAKEALANWRTANDELRQVRKIDNRNPTLETQREIKRLRAEGEGWLNLVDEEAQKAGKGDLAARLKTARVELGKIGTVERSLNEATGDVSARSLLRAKERGVPVSGEAEKAAKFAQGFSKYAQDAKTTSQQGVSKLDAFGGALAAGTFGPKGLALTAIPYVTRNALLSRPVQALALPGRNPGASRLAIGNALRRKEVERLLLSPSGVAGTNALSRE